MLLEELLLEELLLVDEGLMVEFVMLVDEDKELLEDDDTIEVPKKPVEATEVIELELLAGNGTVVKEEEAAFDPEGFR